MSWDTEQPWFLPPELETRAGEAPTAVLVGAIAAKLWAGRKAHLARLPVREIVEILDRVVAGWLAPDSPLDGGGAPPDCRRYAL